MSLIPLLFSLTASPGPSNVLVLASSTNFGYRRTLPFIAGSLISLVLMFLTIGIGLGWVFDAYPIIHTTFKIMSITYLLYLAASIARSGGFRVTSDVPRAMSFIEGGLFQWINPKAWVVVISIVATYTSPAHDLFSQILLICSVFVVVAFISFSLWAFFGTIIAQFLQTSRSMRSFNIILAVILVVSLIPLFR